MLSRNVMSSSKSEPPVASGIKGVAALAEKPPPAASACARCAAHARCAVFACVRSRVRGHSRCLMPPPLPLCCPGLAPVSPTIDSHRLPHQCRPQRRHSAAAAHHSGRRSRPWRGRQRPQSPPHARASSRRGVRRLRQLRRGARAACGAPGGRRGCREAASHAPCARLVGIDPSPH